MCSIILNLPDDSCEALKLSPDALANELRLAAAMKLYEVGRLSAGAAAVLAGVPQPVFLSKLADYNIASFRLSEHELAEEARRA
jgi:predicted HTH domain antitoxin